MHGKLLSSNSRMLTGPWTAKRCNPLNVKSKYDVHSNEFMALLQRGQVGVLCTVSSGFQPEAEGTKMRQWL